LCFVIFIRVHSWLGLQGLAKPISIGAVERVVLNALAKPCGFAASFLAPSAI
jgi:hypothetical protein